MKKSIILVPLILLSSLSIGANELGEAQKIKNTKPRLLKYIDKEFLDLGKNNITGISKILYSTDDSCLLFENKVINCEYKNNKKLKLTLLINKDSKIEKKHFILVQEEVVDIHTIISPENKEKESLKKLKVEILLNLKLKDQIINLTEILKRKNKIIDLGKVDKSIITKKNKKIKSFEMIMKKNRELCEVERSELLSITKDDLYKEISKYTKKSQLILKIKEMEKEIKDLIRINTKMISDKKNNPPCLIF